MVEVPLYNAGEKFPLEQGEKIPKSPPGKIPLGDSRSVRLMTTSLVQRRAIIVGADDDPDDVDLLRLLLRKAGIDHPLEIYRHGEEIMAALSKLADTSLALAIDPRLVRSERLHGKAGAADGV